MTSEYTAPPLVNPTNHFAPAILTALGDDAADPTTPLGASLSGTIASGAATAIEGSDYIPANFVPSGRGARVALGGESHATGAGSLNSPIARNSREPLAWAQVLSGGGFDYVWNFGLASSSIASAMTRLQAALDLEPDAVVLLAGTYDMNPTNAVSFSSYQASVMEFATRVHAIGAVPIVGTVFPTVTAGTERQNVEKANAWLHYWCPKSGVELLDTFGTLVDPTTSATATTLADSSGVHANAAGNRLIAEQLLTILNRVLPMGSAPVAGFQSADSLNIIPNGLFLTPAADPTVPDGWSRSNLTTALVSGGATAKGNWVELTSTNTSTATLLQDALNPADWDAGDRVVLCGRFFHTPGTSAKTLGIQVNFNGGSPNSVRPLNVWAGEVAKEDNGTFFIEMTIPAGTTALNAVFIHNTGTLGTGLKSGVAQLTLLNLTRLGLA